MTIAEKYDRVLKIAVRDANGRNSHINQRVLAMVHPQSARLNHDSQEGTIVYSLKRF